MKVIYSSCGTEIMVSDIDFDELSKYKWYICNGYALEFNSRRKMHRIIMNPKNRHQIVDHKDQNKLNNTRENLRMATLEQNAQNHPKRKNTKNKYKGTFFVKNKNIWGSRCRSDHNDFFLGYYRTEKAAAYAYNKKAKEISKYISLNYFSESDEELEKMIIKERMTIRRASKQSDVKGVYWNKGKGKWDAKIRINGKYKHLGTFVKQKDAENAVINYIAVN